MDIFLPIALVVISGSVWVLVDATTIGVRKGMIRGFFDMGPWGWFFSCVLLFVVGFPAYLAKRQEYKRIAQAQRSPSR